MQNMLRVVLYRAVGTLESPSVAIDTFDSSIMYVAAGTCQRLIIHTQSIVTVKLVEILFSVREPVLTWPGL